MLSFNISRGRRAKELQVLDPWSSDSISIQLELKVQHRHFLSIAKVKLNVKKENGYSFCSI